MEQAKGMICAMVTPMDENGEISEFGIRQLCKRSIEEGIDGIFALGTTGEFFSLTEDEKVEIMKIVIDETKDRAKVYAGCGAVSTGEVIRLIKKMENIGVDAVSVVTPFFITPNQNELFMHYSCIAESTTLPIILYNIPPRTGCHIEAETVSKLAEKYKNIIGIKDSSGKFENILAYINATKKLSHFSVLAGTDSFILKGLQNGAKGAIAATANVVPQVIARIYENYINGDIVKAEEYQEMLVPLRSAFSLGTIPIVLKECTNMIGILAGPPRSPLLRPDEEQRKEIKKMIDKEYSQYKYEV